MRMNSYTIVQTDEFKLLEKNNLCACIKLLNRNQAREDSIFIGLVNRCKVDDTNRENEFPELFENLIKLAAIPREKLEETVFEEDLVTESKRCWSLQTKMFFSKVKSWVQQKLYVTEVKDLKESVLR